MASYIFSAFILCEENQELSGLKQGRTNDYGAPGLTGVMGPSHITHVITIDYDTKDFMYF